MRTKTAALFVFLVAASASANTYVVTNNSDSGPGSLRQAIADANAHPGLDSIDFNLPSSQLFGISPNASYTITDPLILDGATQESLVPPLKVFVAFNGNSDGFVLETGAGGSEIRNLQIEGASGVDHAAIRIAGASGVTIAGNIIGGLAGVLSTNDRGVSIGTSGNRVGGLTANDRNVIGGNQVGIEIRGGGQNNVIEGNYIGVDSDGTSRRPNLSAGISIENGSDNVIGGTTAASRNVFGASPAGIVLFKPSERNRIEQNYFGVTAAGAAAPELGNAQAIVLGGLRDNNVFRNLISNNNFGIVVVEGFNHTIQGNRIGTDAEGMLAIPNGIGISVLNITDVNELLIGGAIEGEGNQICGNTNEGILVDSVSVIRIEGNVIGVNVIGDAALPNGTGVRLQASENTILGGPIQRAGNFISGNRGDGVIAMRGTILGNVIGLGTDRKASVPNGGNGITAVTDGAVQIGQLNGGNLIANNRGWGIDISGTGATAARAIQYNRIAGNAAGGIRLRDNDRHTIRFNSIELNGGLGIDLGGDGITPNDAGDADTGPNLRQNYPVATVTPGTNLSASIRGTLNSAPNADFTIDFYATNRNGGARQGADYLGSVNVHTNASGNAEFATAFSGIDLTARQITATATDSKGNTSEFANVTPPGAPVPSKRRSVRH